MVGVPFPALGSVTDTTTLDVPLGGALHALTGTYFVRAEGRVQGHSNELSITDPDLLTSLIGYIKASNTDAGDDFGWSVALSGDGNTLAVGATGEDSSATGINSGDPSDNDANDAGAVYLYRKVDNLWALQAYIKASNTGALDYFGTSVALSSDGNTLAVGATGEDSSATGIGGNEADDSAGNAGAVYLY